MKENKTRHICDLTFCRHINTENICTIGNQENCVYYKTLQALNGYKENAKWCDDCKKIKELEAEKDKAWWEGFDTCKAKAGEANVKLSDEINLLKAQIEKMRNCGNCNGIVEGGIRTKKCKFCIDSKDLPRWELRND